MMGYRCVLFQFVDDAVRADGIILAVPKTNGVDAGTGRAIGVAFMDIPAT